MDAKSSRIPALSWGCLAALTWGLTGTFIKLLPGFTTLEVLSIRILLAAVVTVIIFTFRPALFAEARSLVRKPAGILLSSLMLFYYLFAVRAFQLAPVSDVALIVGLSPLIGLLVKVVSGEKLVAAEILGAGLAFVGLFLFVVPKVQGVVGDHASYFIGLAFAFLAACVSLGYAAYFKQYTQKGFQLNPIVVSCTTFAIGAVIMGPVTLMGSPDLIGRAIAPEFLKIAVGLGIISTVVPTFCYSYAAKYLSPVLTTTLNLLVPVFAAILAFFLIGETIPALSMVGAALIIVGIVVLSSAKSN